MVLEKSSWRALDQQISNLLNKLNNDRSCIFVEVTVIKHVVHESAEQLAVNVLEGTMEGKRYRGSFKDGDLVTTSIGRVTELVDQVMKHHHIVNAVNEDELSALMKSLRESFKN